MLSTLLASITSQNVKHYIDLPAGSIIIQVLVGGIMGGIFLLKTSLKTYKKFFIKISARFKNNSIPPEK